MHSPFYFIGIHHRPHFSHNSARKEFWNQGISEKTREADAQRSKPSLAQIEAAVQPIIEAMAERFNMSFNFGFRNAEGSIRFAAGPDNRCLPQSPEGCTPTNMSAHTKIPGGSVTKAMTVTRVLQLAEEGLIDLDKAAHLYSDPVTTKLYGWTLAQLWETPAVNKITVRDLMGMTSGLRDYAYMPHSPSPGALYGMHHTTHSRHMDHMHCTHDTHSIYHTAHATCCMLLHATTCHYMPLHATTCYCMLLHATTCCYMLLHAAVCCYMLLHAATCCCMPLHATACYSMLLHATTCYYMLLHATTCYYMLLHADTCTQHTHYLCSSQQPISIATAPPFRMDCCEPQ